MPSECCGIRLESADSCTSFGISNFSALSVETTQMYIHADLQLKEQAMERTKPIGSAAGRYRPTDKLIAFLEAL